MTALRTVPLTSAAHADLPVDLLDALSDAVVAPADLGARSAAICGVGQEVCASLEWRHEGVGQVDAATHDELIGIRQLATAAHDHHIKMDALSPTMAEEDGS